MSEIASWVFLGLAAVHILLIHVGPPVTVESKAAGVRNLLLASLAFSAIAAVLRMP